MRVISTLIVSSYDQRGILCHSERSDWCAHFRDKLAAAGVGCEVPHPDIAMLISCT